MQHFPDFSSNFCELTISEEAARRRSVPGQRPVATAGAGWPAARAMASS